jgi:hypothetical protein
MAMRRFAGDFAASTVSGLALYVLVYSLLGAGFAMAVGGRLPRPRLALASIAFALCWYYAAFHLAAKAVSPPSLCSTPSGPRFWAT